MTIEKLLRPKTQEEERWLETLPEKEEVQQWPFSIRWQDEKRIERWLDEGFDDKDILILGPPQAVEPGIRILTPIVEMAQTMEILRQHNLGIPHPKIFCPIYINALVNNVSTENNEKMAMNYAELATRYFAEFHPDLPKPTLLTDNPKGADLLLSYASMIKDKISLQTQDILLDMADKHTNGSGNETVLESSIAYLLAHYPVYGYALLPEYYDPQRSTLMLIPQSEEKFHDILDQELLNISCIFPTVHVPTEDSDGPLVIGYSHLLTTPHYYPHRNEPDLKSCANTWPTRNQLSRNGINGRARDEIWDSVCLIESDIDKHSIPTLQANVLQPIQWDMYD